MKTTIIFFLFVIVTNFLYGQTITTEIKTPLGSTVPDTYYRGELLNSTQKAALSDSITLNYPNATEVNPASATTFYNCHSFAWYRSEGGDKNVWMGLYYAASEDIYWLDASYIQASTINDGYKISYAGNHSAIVLSGTNCRSKWGAWPLVDHPVGYGPYIYTMSQRTYYTNFHMEGPTILCASNNGTYSTPAYVNCTYNWTYDTNRLDYVSGQGTNNFQVVPKNPLVPGQAWVKLTLTINSPINKTKELTKDVWVGPPSTPVIVGNTSLTCNLYLYRVSDGSQVTWTVSGPLRISGTNYGYKCNIIGTGDGYGWIQATATNDCGSVMSEIPVEVVCGNYLSVTPNPSNGQTVVSIESAQETIVEELSGTTQSISEASVVDEAIPWNLEVYNQNQLLKDTKEIQMGRSTTINTSGWPEGIYIVRVNYNGDILTGKLIVKH